MPSEPRIQHALEALARPRAVFRSAVAMAVDQVGAFLDSNRAPLDGRASRTAHELGAFATGRVDAARFAAVLGEPGVVDSLAVARIERALKTLQQIDGRGDDQFIVRIAAGGDLRAEVARALTEIGRVFAAARAVELARTGRYTADQADDSAAGFAFRHWNRAERQIAPPLIVELDGADLQAGALAEFLDGTFKIVLVVRAPATAAPLTRLITPSLFVEQTTEDAALARLAGVEGPGITALMPEGAAGFVHKPGEAPVWERLCVTYAPTDEPGVAIGSVSAFQRAEELKQLRALATPPESLAHTGDAAASVPVGVAQAEATAPSASGPLVNGSGSASASSRAEGADPVDKLAAWLLSRTDVAAS